MTKIKKAILTGGGRATRLRPITTTINKHLIPLANKPMIFHAIEKAVEAGVEDIYINTNPGETQLQEVVGDGSRWGIKIKFFEQAGGPQGIAHVVNCAQEFIGADPFMFYLSDNIILGSLKPVFEEFLAKQYDCMLAFAKVPDPERFGVPVFSPAGELVKVLEKPTNPPNNFAQTGIFLYGPKVFFDGFKHIEKSPRGEFEISDIHNYFLDNKYKVGWKEITGWWKDTGKPDDLIMANQLLMQELPKENFQMLGSAAEGVKFEGNVQVGIGTTIKGNASLVGPVIIGENCVLEDCVIGPNVTVGAGTTIKHSVIKDSIIFAGCNLEDTTPMRHSILGEQAKIKKNGADGYHRYILGDHTFIE